MGPPSPILGLGNHHYEQNRNQQAHIGEGVRIFTSSNRKWNLRVAWLERGEPPPPFNIGRAPLHIIVGGPLPLE